MSGQSICCTPCFEFIEDSDEIVFGNAFDVIVVQSNEGFFSNENFFADFPIKEKDTHRLMLEVWSEGSELSSQQGFPGTPSRAFDLEFDGSFRGSSSMLGLSLLLVSGRNPVRYLLLEDDKVAGVAHANIFLWSYADKVVISDIDGTITKSSAGGIYDTILTERYSNCHDAVCRFFSSLAMQKKLQVLYVTSRPIVLASRTRKFLNNLRQQQQGLPWGPILGFRGNFAQLFVMELISYQTHHFKAEILWRNVVEPFSQAGRTEDIFHAAFGNTLMDCQAYDMVAVPLHRTYIIQKNKVHTFDRMDQDELIHLRSKEGSDSSKAWGNEMPRQWYKRRFGSTFAGYGDPRLNEHIACPN